MSQAVTALRVASTILLILTEIALVAMFSLVVAADNREIDDVVCLLLHCSVNVVFWTIFVCDIVRQTEKTLFVAILENFMLVTLTGVAFAVYVHRVAQMGDEINFAMLGAPGAYAMLILSWLVTMLSIQSLVFIAIDQHRAAAKRSERPSTSPPTVYYRQNPTPRPWSVMIVAVLRGGSQQPEKTLEVETAHKTTRPQAFITTYNSWPKSG